MKSPDLRIGALVVWLSVSPVSLYAVDVPVLTQPYTEVDPLLGRLLEADANHKLDDLAKELAPQLYGHDPATAATSVYATFMADIQSIGQRVVSELIEGKGAPEDSEFQRSSVRFRKALADLFRLSVRDSLHRPLSPDKPLSIPHDFPGLTDAHLIPALLNARVVEITDFEPVDPAVLLIGDETALLNDFLRHLTVFYHKEAWENHRDRTAAWLYAQEIEIRHTPLTTRLLIILERLRAQYETGLNLLATLQQRQPDSLVVAVIRSWFLFQQPGGSWVLADQALTDYWMAQPEENRPRAQQALQFYRTQLAMLAGQMPIRYDHNTELALSSQWTGWNLLPGAGAEESGDKDYREAARQSVLGLADNAERHKDEINAALHTMKDFLLQYGEADDVPDDPAQQLADKYRCLADRDQCLEPEDSGHGIEAEADEFLPESNI